MQQPSGQYTGPYGNAPYAAPPKRGFNWLACCLGCFGIGVILAIILGALLFTKMNRAAGPAITETNFRDEFVNAGVPIYPGLKLEPQITTAMRFGGAVVGFIPKAGGASLRLMAFRSPKSAQEVGQWYKTKLVPDGWTYRITEKRGTSWEFEKGDTSVIVSDNGQQADTIMIGIAHGLTKGRGKVDLNNR